MFSSIFIEEYLFSIETAETLTIIYNLAYES